MPEITQENTATTNTASLWTTAPVSGTPPRPTEVRSDAVLLFNAAAIPVNSMPSPSSDTKNDPLARRLDEISAHMPSVAQTARFYGVLLPLVREDAANIQPIALAPEVARTKLQQGRFLLQDLDVEIDAEETAGRLVRLAQAAESAGENINALDLQVWLDRHRSDLGVIMQNVLEDGGGMLADAAERMGLDAAVCRALAQNALKPVMRAWGRQLAPLAEGVPWSRGVCFICGALPVFGELQGNSQALHLRCGLCGGDWEYSRLACMFCGTDDHRKRDYLFVENEHEKAHIEACMECNTYIKVIPAFSPTPAAMLPVEDLATLHLDIIAAEKGYRRTSSAA